MVKNSEDAKLLKALIQELKKYYPEDEAEGFAKFLLELKREKVFGFCLDEEGRVEFWLEADNKREAIQKMKRWLTKERRLGKISEERFNDYLRELVRMQKQEYIS